MQIELLCKSKEMQSLLVTIEQGEILPLHDHPMTSVFMYFMSGNLRMKGFSFVEKNRTDIVVQEQFDSIFTQGMNCHVTPDDVNLHSLEALKTSKFIDVMAPGYFDDASINPNWYSIQTDLGEGKYRATLSEAPEFAVIAKEEALRQFDLK